MRLRAAFLATLASAGLVAAGFSAGTPTPVPPVADSFLTDATLAPRTIAQLAPAPTRAVTRTQLLGAHAASVQLVGSPAYTTEGYRDSLQAQLDAVHA